MNSYTGYTTLRAQLDAGEQHCRDIVEAFLARIKEKSALNVFLEVFEEDALKQAEQVQDKLNAGTAGRLAGMVIALKDNICYAGHRVGASSKILEGFESLYSATAVERLLAEDVIIIGRTNCDEFAMGASTENSAFGSTLNATDTQRVPGGSSGGSAVAVQAGLCHAALGSDTGGSVRQPASFCGVVGYRPTYGAISRYGLLAYASSFDIIGPLTHTIEDATLLTAVMSGQDANDATSAPDFKLGHEVEQAPKEGLRIAFLKDCVEHEGVDSEINSYFNGLREKLAENHTVTDIEFPYLDYVVPAYYTLTTAEASSNLSRYAGMTYGHRSPEAEDIDSTIVKSRTEGFGPEVKRRIMLGTFVLSAGYYDAYYAQGQKVRRLIRDYTLDIFKEYDYVMLPTAPHTAFELGANADPISMYLEDIFCIQASLAGTPAISLPMGEHSNGMPFGVQVMANKKNDAGLLNFSKSLLGK